MQTQATARDVSHDVAARVSVSEPQVHLATRHEYQLLAQAGAFLGRRVELINGVIYEKMAAMLSPHATTVRKSSSASHRAFAGRAAIAVQYSGARNGPGRDFVGARN